MSFKSKRKCSVFSKKNWYTPKRLTDFIKKAGLIPDLKVFYSLWIFSKAY